MVAVHHQPYSRLAIKQGTRAASLETQPYQHLIVNTVQMSRLLIIPTERNKKYCFNCILF
ncbi:hypothetical protein XNW1_630001 [Xenorhabdus nematophila str. Websteri]|nr:hypothetical protein XNW1_2530001 [Xenorhabdus nematophila str. Websteri]CEF33906.1 hypothetical protein XNW1_630001 [Xenorhabdus nematophila str. Websteri]